MYVLANILLLGIGGGLFWFVFCFGGSPDAPIRWGSYWGRVTIGIGAASLMLMALCHIIRGVPPRFRDKRWLNVCELIVVSVCFVVGLIAVSWKVWRNIF